MEEERGALMFFDPNEWTLNANMDMLFNVKTYRTIRKRTWRDNAKPDGSNDFNYFSFHDLNASQTVAFLFSSQEDAELVHSASVKNNWNFNMVDFQMWNELNVSFQNGIERDRIFPESDY